jgi:hypothetical protein
MKFKNSLLTALFLTAAWCAVAQPVNNPAIPAPVSITAKNSPYQQLFNTLDTLGTNQTALPAGWQVSETGSGANGGYRANNGSSNTGDIYSFGKPGNPDRSFGSVGSGSLRGRFGAYFINGTGSMVDSVRIEYTMEQWRQGALRAFPDTMYFEYSINKNSIDTNNKIGWTRVNSMDLISKSFSSSTSIRAMDADSVANQNRHSITLSGLTINPGDTFVIRFIEVDIAGSDDGLSIDSFSLVFDPLIVTPQPVTALTITPSLDAASGSYTAPGNFSASTQQFLAFLKQASPITAGTPTANPASYTANSNFTGNGTPYQNDASAKCVYKGTGTTFNITGLTPNTTYHLLILTVSTADSIYSSGASAQTTTARTRVNFTAKSGSQIEGAVSNTISVSITNPGLANTDTTFVELHLTGGDATNGVDLATTFNTVTLKFPGNSTAAQTVNFGTANDITDEWNETLVFTLRSVSGGAAAILGTDTVFTYTIIDNDGITNPASGDLAFTTVQTDDPDAIELITLKRLDLRNMGITDKGIQADQSFIASEGIYYLPALQALNDVPAGTRLQILGGNGVNDTIWTDGVLRFFQGTILQLSTTADQVIAFTGFNSFVAGINTGNSGWITTGTPNTNTSYAPGTSADFHAGDRDNARFRGPVLGIGSVIRDSLRSFANWDTSDTRFSTDFTDRTMLFNEPASQGSNLATTATGLSSISLRWNASTSAQRYVVVMHTASTMSNPADSFTYNSSANYNTADTVVTSASAFTKGTGRVVYSGHDTSVTVNGLANGTRYFYRIYSFNGNGINANYNTTTPLAGDTATQSPIVPVVKFGRLTSATSEDSTTVTIPVRLMNSTNTAVSVNVSVKGGTATTATDYQLNNTTINFNGTADSTANITVSIVNDNLVEGSENLQLVLNNITSPAIIDADSVHTITIADNDFTKIGFEVSAQTIAETIDTARIRVVMKDPGSNVPYTVNVSATPLTATTPQDYTLLTTSLSFAGAADSVKTVLVRIFNTQPLEGDERFVLQLSNPSTGAILTPNATDTITITNATYPYYPIGQINNTDANGVLDSLNRRYEVRGIVYGVNIRTAGLQFTINDGTGGLGTFSPSATFGYTVKEGDSVIIYGRVAQFNGLAQIDNIDTLIVAGTNKAVKAPVTVNALSEATESEYIMFPSLTLSPNANWPVTPFTGTGRNLFAYVNGNPNDSIQVRIVGTSPLNGSPRPAGAFAMIGIGGQFDNSNPFTSGYQLFPMFLNHVINGDTVSFTTPSVTVTEAAGTLNISVSLKNATALPTSVDVVVTGGNATAGSDFTYTTQTVTFAANSNAAQTVTLSITDDNLFESNDTIVLSLQNATNNAFIDAAANTYTIVITDNDPNGVKELNAVAFNLYPNPAREVVRVEALQNITEVMVSDLTGQEVARTVAYGKSATLDTRHLKAGVYFVRVSTAEGSSVKKVVIQ